MSARELEASARRHGIFLCVECGKCSAVCPMAELFDDYRYEVSPRGIIERALLGLDFGDEADLWSCLTCDLCTRLCPQGVRVRDFILEARERALAAGFDARAAYCRECRAYLGPAHTEAYLENAVGEDADGLLALCPACRRRRIGVRHQTAAISSVHRRRP